MRVLIALCVPNSYLFHCGHAAGCIVACHCGFIDTSLVPNEVEPLFNVLIGTFGYPI